MFTPSSMKNINQIGQIYSNGHYLGCTSACTGCPRCKRPVARLEFIDPIPIGGN